jgi:hypothetical protein
MLWCCFFLVFLLCCNDCHAIILYLLEKESVVGPAVCNNWTDFSGSWEIRTRQWDQGKGRSCMWGILKLRVGIWKGNAGGWTGCFSVLSRRTMLYALVYRGAMHLVLPRPSRSLLCSCWVCFTVHIAHCSLLMLITSYRRHFLMWEFMFCNLKRREFVFIFWIVWLTMPRLMTSAAM